MNAPLLQSQGINGALDRENAGNTPGSRAWGLDPLTWEDDRKNLRSGLKVAPCLAVWPTASHPKLLLPLDNVAAAKQGVNLYEPYSLAGKVSKVLLQGMVDLSALGLCSRRTVTLRSEVLAEIAAVILKVTGEERPYFAILHGGTDECPRLTAQVMRPSGEILGYLKFAFCPDQAVRLRHERKILERLSTVPQLRRHIPQVLFAGEKEQFCFVFLSALSGNPGPTEITAAHEEMLSILRSADPVHRPGALLIDQIAHIWEGVQCPVSPELLHLRDKVFKVCSDNLGTASISCGVNHGDFAPWNTRIHDGQLTAFDWEHSCWNAPVQWDKFHFYVQVAVCLNRPHRKKLQFAHPAEGSLLLLYLLNSIPQLLTKSTRRNLYYRTSLLNTQLSSPHRDEFWIA